MYRKQGSFYVMNFLYRFSRVEWATLVFFAALFVLMESLAQLGLLNAIGSAVENIILQVPKDYR